MAPQDRWPRIQGGIYLLVGLAALAWLLLDQRRAAAQQELPRTGRSVQGRLDDLESRRGAEQLTISYSFTVNGHAYEQRRRRVADFDGLTSEGPVTVWYDPADPARCITANELRHSRFSATPWMFGAVIALMMVLAARQARKALPPGRETEPED